MGTEHPAWCLGTEPEGEPHTSAVVHAAAATDIDDIRLCLIQLEGVAMVKIELMEDEITNLYILPLEQLQILITTAAALLVCAGQAVRLGPAVPGLDRRVSDSRDNDGA